MIQEDKELLLKDLSARLFYGVKVNVIYSNENASSFRQRVCVKGDNELNTDIIGLYQRNEIDIKPYLFPLSSMTGEQKKEMRSFDPFKTDEVKTFGDWAVRLVEFYNKHHLDYHGLVEKGLAIDATELNIY